jgi:energy-coupling factor transport system permease protein
MGVMLAVSPEWRTIAAAAAVVVLGFVAARVPWGARPRLPQWFWIVFAIGFGLNFIAGGPPNVHIAGATIGCGALIDWLRATSIALLLLAGAILVSWTTPLADVPAALAALTRPLRWVRLPVDEWLETAAVALRAMPLMTDEIRTLLAARRLRTPNQTRQQRTLLALGAQLLIAIMIVGARRAHDFADAVDARGAFVVRRRRLSLGARDLTMLAVLAGAIVVAAT